GRSPVMRAVRALACAATISLIAAPSAAHAAGQRSHVRPASPVLEGGDDPSCEQRVSNNAFSGQAKACKPGVISVEIGELVSLAGNGGSPARARPRDCDTYIAPAEGTAPGPASENQAMAPAETLEEG